MQKLTANPYFIVPLGLLALVLLMFGDVLFGQNAALLSSYRTDTANEFLYWRDFGFSHLRHGEVPLWNPHVFSGADFVGNFQSALFYPPNWIYLFLPLHTAINCEFILAAFLTGLWIALWALKRGLHPAAAFAAAALLMFGAPYFLRIYAGHLAPLDAMCWVPAVLFAVEGWLQNRTRGWLLFGTAAIAMQILAGHPQTVFCTAIAAGLYALLQLINAPRRLTAIAGLIGMSLGAIALAAIQLLPGIESTAEATRHHGVPYQFASMFSLPAENFLTLLVPNFFGNILDFHYWGRYYLWEMSLYMGVIGFALAMYGVFCSQAKDRRLLAIMALLLLWIALGDNTPLLKMLYYCVPGFKIFRAHSKFLIEASVFLALLAGIGLDALFRSALYVRRTAAILLVFGILIGVLGIAIRASAGGNSLWARLVLAVPATRQSYMPLQGYQNSEFIHAAGLFAAHGCFLCAGLLCGAALLFFYRRHSQNAAWLLAVVAVLEVFAYARATRTTFDPAAKGLPQMQSFAAEHPGDYRILQLTYSPETALSSGAQDIWGDEPIINARYGEFMAMTQGQDPDSVTQYITFTHNSPLYRLLRCRYLFLSGHGNIHVVETPNSLPHVLLLQKWRVIPQRDQIFAAMEAPDFDPGQKVILETPPIPAPAMSAQTGTVSIVASGTDFLTIEASLPQPAILLITDAYSRAWRAVALPGSVQQHYQIQPGDYVLRAIPLTAGKHRLRVEYSPVIYRIGEGITLVALLLYLALLVWYLRHIYYDNFPTTPSPSAS